MREEPAKKLGAREGKGLAAVVVLAIPVGEGNGVVTDVSDSVIGDGGAVSVPGQVVEDDLGASTRSLGVDDPGFLLESLQEGTERLVFGKLMQT